MSSDALLLDTTAMTFHDADENVDDTCFSAFSEVPNMDMTRFAQLGRLGVMGGGSPTKTSLYSFSEQVRETYIHTQSYPTHMQYRM